MLLTLGHMHVFPQQHDAHVLTLSCKRLGIKALGFVGFLLVKSPTKLKAVVAEGLANILKGIACKSMHEIQLAGGPELDGNVGIL